MNGFYQVCYFGILSERRGLAEESLDSPARTPAELFDAIDATCPLGMARLDIRAAVNDEFVTWDHPLKDGDRVAFLPPMSGG
jgi:molybdopterin converting factor small subunit